MLNLNNIRFECWQTHLDNWCVLEVSGKDRVNFLHGQLTNDIKKIKIQTTELNTRLNQVGKVQSFFYVASHSEIIFIFILKEFAEELLADLNKFIIMEEVEIKRIERDIFFIGNSVLLNKEMANSFLGNYLGICGSFTFEKNDLNIPSFQELNLIKKLNGYPDLASGNIKNIFINESRLNEIAISYNKGCFLGQETVAKIENNRGAITYPFLVKLENHVEEFEMKKTEVFFNENKVGYFEGVSSFNNQDYAHMQLTRENRVIGKKISFHYQGIIFCGEVTAYPLFKASSPHELSIELFDKSVKLFNIGKTSEAIINIEKSILFESNSDNLEIKGAMLGRLEQYTEAIEVMDELIALDPTSVMAHTNKSLYLMKLGKISEAEEEKSLATVKSFEMFGNEAKFKKAKEEEKQKRQLEMSRREEMFFKVLAIDSEDAIANLGLGEICFERKNFEKAINFLKAAIHSNPNYSAAYLLLGKALENSDDRLGATEVYEKGIVIATKKGEMMPANEMQARLNKL
jgi:folate-binding protein YgfZ